MEESSNKKHTIRVFVAIVILGILVFFVTTGQFANIFEKREFDIVNESYISEDAVVRITQGNAETGYLTGALFQGRIERSPTLVAESGNYEMQMSFMSGNGRENVQATVVLGGKDAQILTLFPEGGVIDGPEEWVLQSIHEIASLLIKGDPLFVRLYVADDVSRTFAENENCGDECQKFLAQIEQFGGGTVKLIEQVQGTAEVSDRLKVGPASAMIIYTQ